jgi:DNA-binding response OmpR family regulator
MQAELVQTRFERMDRSAPERRKPLVPWHPKATLLLVEDDDEMRRMLARALRRDEHRVVECTNGDQAFDWLGAGVIDGNRAYLPDLVISDIRLPYFDGFEILESLQVASRRIPVILITGFPDEARREKARTGGAFCLLEKPFELADLREAVRLALRSDATNPGSRDGAS